MPLDPTQAFLKGWMPNISLHEVKKYSIGDH
ncbi:MAG: hypothetical protein PWQ47_742 [Methanothermococcus sp.]|jgi:hypothetical protein|nr:hypothetical protein [Methanothermococcus sp.]